MQESTIIFNMIIYSITSTFICCMISGLYCANRHYSRKIQIDDLFGMLALICLSGLRYEVGSDYIRYQQGYLFAANRFRDLSTLFTKEVLSRYTYEVGYETLSVFTYRLFHNEYAIFWVVAIILYIPLVFYCRKRTNDAHVAFATFVLFGFWGLSLNIMKQAIAMMLAVCFYEFLKKKKYIRAVLCAIIAFSFHTTSIVAIGVIVLVHIIAKKVNISTKRNLRLIVLIGIALRFGTSLLLAVMSHISPLSKYVYYLDSEYTRINRSFIWIGALVETIVVIIIIYIAINKIDDLQKRNPENAEIIAIIMMGIPLSIIGVSRRLWLANRFAKFFFLFLIVLLPSLIGRDYSVKGKLYLFHSKTRVSFWIGLITWHILYSVLLLDNNLFHIGTYLFK